MKIFINMTMKSGFQFLVVALVGLMISCSPLGDVYDKIDEEKTAGQTIDLAVTLSSKDYEIPLKYAENANDSSSMSTFKNFSDAQARKYVPYILDSKYPALGAGSSVAVTFDLYQGSASDVNTYTRATAYTVSADDYASVDESVGIAEFFSPSYLPSASIPGLLLANIQDAVEGDVYGVSYEYSTTDPTFDYENAGDQTVYSEGFTADISAFTTVEVSGAQAVWSYVIFGSGAAQGSGFSGGNQPNEEWLVSPEIDLTSITEAKLLMSHVTRFLVGATISDFLNVKVSSDYTGDITTATWENVTFATWVDAGSSNTFVDIETDFSAFTGKKITIALAYVSTTAFAPRWQVASLSVTTPGTVGVIAEDPISYVDYYAFSGTAWSKDTRAYSLVSTDYNEMGAPGQYDNFSSSLPADDYITVFLTNKYPYALEEDELIVVYKYFSSSSNSTQTRGNLYTFLNGAWNPYTTVVSSTLNFGRDTEAWVPDNTIKFTLAASDITFIAEWKGLDTGPGGNFKSFGSFDVRSSSTNYWSSEDLIGAFDALLKSLYPASEIGQKFQISYKIYDGALKDATSAVILGESGYTFQ